MWEVQDQSFSFYFSYFSWPDTIRILSKSALAGAEFEDIQFIRIFAIVSRDTFFTPFAWQKYYFKP